MAGARRLIAGLRMALGALLAVLCVITPGWGAEDADWRITAKTQWMFSSYTAYEFGNPLPPHQSPLSRLEFPLNTVWTGVEARRNLGRLSLGLEYLSSVVNQEAGQFKDYDWDNDSDPQRLSIFGETHCRLRPSFQIRADFDVEVGDALRLPEAFSLRPVVGFRWQHFSFLAHDGTQRELDAGGAPTDVLLLGDSISFKQEWYQFFVGLRLGYEWTDPPWLHRVALSSQVDWSYVLGQNEDRHLLRGDRTTRDDTVGYAWRYIVGLTLGLTEVLDLGVEGAYSRIETHGTHKCTEYGMGMRWEHGVRAWSEQSSVTVKLEYRF